MNNIKCQVDDKIIGFLKYKWSLIKWMINLLKYKFLSSVNINLLNKNYKVYAFILFINLNFFILL